MVKQCDDTREHGVLFSAPLIRALLDGRKTVTRRIIARSNSTVDGHGASPDFWGELDFSDAHVDPGLGAGAYLKVAHLSGETRHRVRCRWQIGDRIYAKETHVIEYSVEGLTQPLPHDDGRPVRYTEHEDSEPTWEQPHYRATDPAPDLVCERHGGPCCHWRPSIFMPRWASRIVREIVSVRPERLHEITAEDARAEGMPPDGTLPATVNGAPGSVTYFGACDPRLAFAQLWDGINGKTNPWASNCWVWRVELREVQP